MAGLLWAFHTAISIAFILYSVTFYAFNSFAVNVAKYNKTIECNKVFLMRQSIYFVGDLILVIYYR